MPAYLLRPEVWAKAKKASRSVVLPQVTLDRSGGGHVEQILEGEAVAVGVTGEDPRIIVAGAALVDRRNRGLVFLDELELAGDLDTTRSLMFVLEVEATSSLGL